MVYLNYSILQMTCAECGYISQEFDDFVTWAEGTMLCHGCYDQATRSDETARKSKALADSINTDYFDQEI